jgi:hypothetical protein
LAWDRIKALFAVSLSLFALWLISITVITAYAHAKFLQNGVPQEIAIPASYWDIMKDIATSTELRPLLQLGAVAIVVFATFVDWYYRGRFRLPLHSALRKLLAGSSALGQQIYEGDNGDQRIAKHLLGLKNLTHLTFVGARFYGLFSRNADFLHDLRKQRPDLELFVMFHNPWEKSMLARFATLGYSRERGVLAPLQETIAHVQDVFGPKAAGMVSEPLSCRVIIAKESSHRTTAIVQPLRKLHEAKDSGGRIFASTDAPGIIEVLVNLVEQRQERSIVLEEDWISDDLNGERVKAFVSDAKLGKDPMTEQQRKLLLHQHFGRFIFRRANSVATSALTKKVPAMRRMIECLSGFGEGI